MIHALYHRARACARTALLMLCIMIALPAFSDSAHAANTPVAQPAATPEGTCTTDPQFTIPVPAPGQGLISTIVKQIQNILTVVWQQMFLQITNDSGYRETIQALATLYIIFYGIMFTFGMVQITLFDFSIRMIKVGIIIFLLSGSFGLFTQVVVNFFNAGTDQWINQISAAVLGIPTPPTAPPFYAVDAALSKVTSAKTAVTLMAMFFTLPYGPIFGLLLALGLGTFVRAILTAAWVYLMSLILKTLLFGLAPIFLSFLLFVRTRYLFDGWLNQIVNATLQPIFLFTFLGFFVKLIGVALDTIFMTPVCWTEWGESLRGSPFSIHYWRFALCEIGGTGDCEPFSGSWTWDGASGSSGNAPIFPIDILAILVLVMLADLCSRFNNIVTVIASDIAGAATNIATMQGAMTDWFKPASALSGNTRAGTQQAVNDIGAQLPNQRFAPGVGSRQGTNLTSQTSTTRPPAT